MPGRSSRTAARPASRRPFTAAALLLAACALGAAAEPPAEAGTWWRAEAPNFALFTNAGPEAARQAATDLQRLRAYLVEIAPSGRFDSPVPFRVYLFDDSQDLVRYQPAGGSGAGFVIPGTFGVTGAAVWATDGGNAGRFLYKQYLHWVLHENLPELPEWFRQGLAEYYGTFRVDGGEAKLGLPVEEHVLWLRQSFGPQRLRLALGPSDGGDSAFHPVAWALVHYLLLGNDETRPRVVPWVHRVVGGADPDRAFREEFGAGREELAERLRDYVLGESFRYLRVPVSSSPQPEVAVSELPPAEVDYRLGELLLQGGEGDPVRRSAAAARFRRALSLEPEHAGTTAALGRLAAAAGDAAGALAAYERAVARQGDDFRLHYLLGDALLATLERRRPASPEEEATLARAVAALRQTTELAPELAVAWERLGFALNLLPQAGPEAVAALRRALELAPDRPDVILNLLLAHARLGAVEAVDAALGRLETLGADEATLRRARETRLWLSLREAEALARANRLDDAVALFARVRAETSDPALAEAAGKQLELVARVEQRNRYAALYQQAAGLLDAGDPAAHEVVAELRAMARPGLQAEAADALARRLPP